MVSNPSPKKPQQQQSSLLSFFNKKPSGSIIEKEATTAQLAVKETASKPVKHDQQKQAVDTKKPSMDAMDVDEANTKEEDDSEDDAPLVSKLVYTPRHYIHRAVELKDCYIEYRVAVASELATNFQTRNRMMISLWLLKW